MYNNFGMGMNNNMGMMNGMGTNYGNQKPVKMTQALSPEEMKLLQKQDTGLSTQITQEDELKAYCTHKDPNTNRIAAQYDENTGMYYCPICREHFAAVDVSPEDAQIIVDNFISLLQNCKLMYLDIPQNFAREYFKILPLAKKAPQIFSMAVKNFKDHENGGMVNYNSNMYGANMLNSIMGAGVGMGQQMMMGGMNSMNQGMNPGMMNPQQMQGMNPGMMNPQQMQGMNPGMMNPQMQGMNPGMMNPQMQGMNPGMMNPQMQGMQAANPFTGQSGAAGQQNESQDNKRNIEHRTHEFSV